MQDIGDPPLPSLSLNKYPRSVTVAGMIWIVVGALTLLDLVLGLLTHFGFLSDAGLASTPAVAMGGLVGRVFGGLVGCFFIFEGVESIRGSIPSTVGLALGSILLALLGLGVFFFRADLGKGTNSALLLITPAGLLLAGVLAVKGRVPYEAWHREERRRRGRGEI